MRIINPYIYIYSPELERSKLLNIERAARLCYKSEGKMGDEPSEKFLRGIISRGHESVIEHEKVTAYFVCDRGVTHEIVRHRVASYSQESTRYCNYNAEKFGGEITVIRPYFFPSDSEQYRLWLTSCEAAEKAYIALVGICTPQEARSVLPNSLKTEIAVTYNLREWRHFFALRCAKEAHPQMRQVTIPLLKLFREKLSPVFDGISYDVDFSESEYASIEIR